MRTLKELNKELAEVEKTAAMNIEEIPASVRGGWTTSIEKAKTDLKALRAAYKKVLLSNGVAIFLTGDSAKVTELAKLADEEGGIVVDANALYERLAKEVEQTISDQRSWGIHQVHKFHLALQEVMHEVGLSELPMPSRDTMPLVKTFQDVVDHIRSVLRAAVGDQLNAIYIEAQAAKRAFEIRYIGVMTPVLIAGAKDGEFHQLSKSFGKGTATVNVLASDEVNKEFLGKALKQIRKNK
jgi:predicted nucleic acid-binding protein